MYFLLLISLAFGQIQNSAHDFSAKSWNTEQEICIVCHAPHNAQLSEVLWNHDVTVSTFTVYSSSSLNATMSQPSGVSKLCLSCHDGTVAVDSYGGATGNDLLSGNKNLGSDLSNDHPISFTYDLALTNNDGELSDPALNSGLGSSISQDMLFNNSMECASCHDVHGTSYNNLLIMSNSGSALCLTCHIK